MLDSLDPEPPAQFFRKRRIGQMAHAPLDHLFQEGMKRGTHRGQAVGVAHGMLLVRFLGDYADFFQALEPIRQHICGNLLARLLQLVVELFIEPEQVTYYEQRPLVAEEIQRASDSARRALVGLF